MVDIAGIAGDDMDVAVHYGLAGNIADVCANVVAVRPGRSLPGLFALQDVPDFRFQAGHLICDVVPEDRWFDPVIYVGEDIPEPCDLFPVSLRVPLLEINRKVLDRFTDDLKIPDHRILPPPVRNKIIK